MTEHSAAKASKKENSTGAKISSDERLHHPILPNSQAGILALQQAAGNRAVNRLLQPGKDNRTSGGNGVPPIVNDVLHSPGHPLDPTTRAFMESHFKQDFSQVRVHTDGRAAESAQVVKAVAYTTGQDVVFGAGKYAPKTTEGQHLLAHELTHVVQRVGSVGDELRIGSSHDSAEGEAAIVARSIVAGQHVPVSSRVAPNIVMRQQEGATSEWRQEEKAPGFWGTIGGGLMGEFKEDQTSAMMGIDVGVSLIPILDQISDVRDIIAHLYYLIAKKQYDRFMRWVGLVFTLIGLIPEVGSAIKGASKFIIKGVREVISRLGDILRPFQRVFPELLDLGRLSGYVTRNWNRFVIVGMAFWNRTLARVTSIVNRIPSFLSRRIRPLREGLARIREIAPAKLRDAFAWVKQKWDSVIEAVQERLGRRQGPPSEVTPTTVAPSATTAPSNRGVPKKPSAPSLPSQVTERGESILDTFAEGQRKSSRGALEADIKAQQGVQVTTKPGGKPVPEKFDVGNFSHQYAEELIPESRLPRGLEKEFKVKLPDGGTKRIDRLDRTNGKFYEIKPDTPSEVKAGQNQVKIYEEYLNRHFPLNKGQKWEGKVVTYNRSTVVRLLKRIGWIQ